MAIIFKNIETVYDEQYQREIMYLKHVVDKNNIIFLSPKYIRIGTSLDVLATCLFQDVDFDRKGYVYRVVKTASKKYLVYVTTAIPSYLELKKMGCISYKIEHETVS